VAIGPEAARRKSGRIVVLAAQNTVIGALAVLLGSGPGLTGADWPAQVLGGAAVIAGLTMLVAATGLIRRRPWGRAAGISGGYACAALGALILALAAYELARGCPARRSGCGAEPFVASLVSVALIGAGAVGVVVVKRARLSYFRS
jgi:hypothetical protein